MKLTTTVFVVAIMGASTWGQLANPGETVSNVRSQVKMVTDAANQRREKMVEQAGQQGSQTAPQAEVKSAKTRVTNGSRSAAKGKTAKAAVPEQKTEAASAEGAAPIHMRGKRDPFVSVIRSQSLGGGNCATGKKCLVIGDIALKGIVRSEQGMIAVVENGERKTYFLHENDPVFNGHVVKIEPDGIVFRETVVDRAGRQSTREVVKRILKPSIS